ncbi:hypothetical protein LINPERPRIM_LOCUS755 [Linum perenne]
MFSLFLIVNLSRGYYSTLLVYLYLVGSD